MSPPSRVDPALKSLYIIDTLRNDRIHPNNLTEPYRLENDLFVGDMVALIRTPSCEGARNNTRAADPVADYLHDKQRRFEFQFQFQLKRLPEGQVFFAGEVDEPCKLGVFSRTFVGAALAFVKAKTKNFRYSISGSKYNDQGQYEVPHLAFPYEQGMSRVVVSRPGEPIPKLGQEIPESDEEYAARKKGKRKIVPELGTTYTMAIWSAYCDYLEWKCVNLPGLRPISMASIIGQQALRMTLYEVPLKKKHHYRKDINVLVSMEMCNTQHMPMGRSCKAWKASQAKLASPPTSEESVGDITDVEVDDQGRVVVDGDEDELVAKLVVAQV